MNRMLRGASSEQLLKGDGSLQTMFAADGVRYLDASSALRRHIRARAGGSCSLEAPLNMRFIIRSEMCAVPSPEAHG